MRAWLSKRQTPRNRSAGAFTLIEVLVVVAIIALLAAILLPSLSRARWQARSAVCKTNLRSLGSVSLIYANSYRNYYPLTSNSGEDNFFALWKARLLPDLKILICPSTRNVIRPETLQWDVAHRTGPEGTPVAYLRQPSGSATGDLSRNTPQGRDDGTGGHSYEYQGCYDGSPNPASPYKGQHRKLTHFPGLQSQLAIMFDNDPSMETVQGWTAAMAREGCTPSRSNNGNNCPQPWDNHGADGTNFLFMDGHVEFVKKIAGDYNDLSAKIPGSPDYFSPSLKASRSALIDQVLVRTQYPWQYYRR